MLAAAAGTPERVNTCLGIATRSNEKKKKNLRNRALLRRILRLYAGGLTRGARSGCQRVTLGPGDCGGETPAAPPRVYRPRVNVNTTGPYSTRVTRCQNRSETTATARHLKHKYPERIYTCIALGRSGLT